ncbi:septation ring formation regulator EzrA [Paenibacillus thalictri]|uniref:TPM domain-containing protein n=1 Tax=Paenibacillus thalictri TaxID=2527873 RepID=A0A4Q9DMH5_9BACL|nr:septation ring formation regulator EzrA [Paenibacillus thalictri]TBL74623.1 hypothetical protein EYB31_25230 [Paenibacillus thalictri]
MRGHTYKTDGSNKRILSVVLILVLSLLIGTVCLAADTPARKGYVTDPVGVFSKEDAAKLEKELPAKKLKVSVLTGTNLSETNSDALAKDAYTKWGLKSDSAVVVITTKPNLVTVYYDNAELKNAVNALPDSGKKDDKKLKQLIDKEFVPFANKGKLADGVLAISDALSGLLKAPAPAASPAPAAPPANAQSAPPAVDKSSSANPAQPTAKPAPAAGGSEGPAKSTPIAAEKAKGSSKFGFIILLIVIALIVIYAIYAIRKRTALKAQAAELLSRNREVWEKISAVLDHSLITSDLEQGFVEAKTKTMLSGVKDEADTLKTSINETNQRLRGFAPPYLIFASAQNDLNDASASIDSYESECGRIGAAFDEIVTAGKMVKEISSHVNTQMVQLQASIAQWRTQSGYPLESMTMRVEQAKAKAADAENNDDFDVMQAKDEIQEAAQLLAGVDGDIQALPLCLEKVPALPREIDHVQSEMDAIKRKERLLLAEYNPFDVFPAAKQHYEHAFQQLQSGYATEAARIVNETLDHLNEARKSLTAIAEQRDKNNGDMDEAERRLAELLHSDARFNSEIDRLTHAFAGKHWNDLPPLFADLKREAAAEKSRIPQLRTWNGDNVQMYSKAAAELASLLAGIGKLEETRQEALARFESLAQKEKEYQSAFAESKSQFHQSLSLLETSGMANNDALSPLRQNVQRRIANTDALFVNRPVDLDDVHYQLQQIKADVQSFDNHVHDSIRQKKEAEARLRELTSMYASSRSRYRNHSRLTSYSHGYDNAMHEASRLLGMGFYAEAIVQMNQANTMLSEMETEHNRIVREEEEAQRREAERRAEAEAAAERDRRRSEDSATSSWGNDSSSNSSSDSATSSWGNDSGSSGSNDNK